jgi:hypothetical protein
MHEQVSKKTPIKIIRIQRKQNDHFFGRNENKITKMLSSLSEIWCRNFPCSPCCFWRDNTLNKNGMTMGAEIEELNLFQVFEFLLSVSITYPLDDAWQFVCATM